MNNSINDKLKKLKQLYDLYSENITRFDFACERFCSDCCTRNVTATSLEAFMIVERLLAEATGTLLDVFQKDSDAPKFQPKLTFNQLAGACARGEDSPEEQSDPSSGSCPILKNRECPIYDFRPFGCRCFSSSQRCSEFGYADLDPFVLTLNNVFVQLIEHIDVPGFTGNLTDMMVFMSSEENRNAYRSGMIETSAGELIPNHAIPVLPVPPEHRDGIQEILNAVHRAGII